MNLSEAERFLEKRIAARAKASRPDLLRDLWPEARACVLDQSLLKAVFCTRRAAKTYSYGVECVLDSYDFPGAKYLFLGLVREEARGMFWVDVLKDLDRRHGIGMRFNETRLEATMPNGAAVVIGAADASEDEMRKLLGQKYRRVCIDEAQDWVRADLNELVFSTLLPALTDLRGSISVRGTPGKLSKGFFRDITPISVQAGIHGAKGKLTEWSLHCWDTCSNTARMPSGRTMAEEWIEKIALLKATKPGIEETPAFRRNYLGEWVVEDEALVYRYMPGRNDFDGKLPEYRRGSWHYVLGIDLGWDDATSHVLWAYHDHDPVLYGLKAEKEPGLDITATAEKTKRYEAAYPLDAMVIDGANKQAVMEMRHRHGLPLETADKTGKADFIELMNAEFITGQIKLGPDCAPLKDEYASLIWNDKSLKREEHPACENHAADGALYAWRRCYQFLSERPAGPPPPVGTPEWAAAETSRMEAQALEEFNDRQEALKEAGWESGW